MEFSDPYNSTISAWSPDGRFVAVATEYRVYAREAASLRVTNIFTCLDTVDQILWSADSGYLLCSMHKRGVVQAWSLEHPEWVCKIDEGMSGLRYSRWSPDGAYILNFADFQLHTTIWSLVHRTRAYIKFPKFFDRGCAFSRDGQFLALADRQNMKDHISIFSCESWHVLKRFSVGTSDLDDVSWAPDDHAICVWDSALVYRVMLYSPDGRKLAQYCAYENGLGIKTVRWCSDGKFLAIGSYDAKLRILNELTWRPLATYDHARVIDSRAATVASAVIYKETTFYDSVKQCSHSRYELQATPFTLGPVSAARPTQTVSKFEDENIGITCVEWSCEIVTQSCAGLTDHSICLIEDFLRNLLVDFD